MDENFWHERWAQNRIGFHRNTENALLVNNIGALALAPGARVFVPLCGKTRDIAWLLAHGHRVVGAELSRTAVEQLFEELGEKSEIESVGNLVRFSARNVEVYAGNIFDLSAGLLGGVDAVYDRAALVALPEGQRGRYADHVYDITAGAPQLVICFEYDQSAAQGPPFSITAEKLAQVYGAHYSMTELARVADDDGMKGVFPAEEVVWLLTGRKESAPRLTQS